MKKINIKITVLAIFAVLSSLAFAGGGPLIGVGVANEIPAVMITGIVMVAFDFYACPILWIIFAGYLNLRTVVKAVEEENLYTVEEIAKQQNKDAQGVATQIRTSMAKGYLKGYLFDGEKLTLNENRKQGKRLLKTTCPNCGATYGYYSDEDGVCPYCGTPAGKH